MATQNPNMMKLIQKILSDPRVVDVITQTLIDILSQQSNLDVQAENATTTQLTVKRHKKVGDWDTKSDNTLRGAYTYRKKHGQEIEPELNAILAARFPGYDATTKKFTGHGGRRKSDTNTTQKKVRIINWTEKSDIVLRRAYQQRAKTANGIDDALNAELARRFPDKYDPATRTFIKKPKTHNIGTKNVTKSAIATLPPAKTTTQTEKPAQLSVTLKPVKQSLDATYNNVYVNGRLILRNHANTELKLFGDGTLLGVYGIVTTDKDLPQRPLWMVYDTNLVPNKWSGRDKCSGYSIYAKTVLSTPTGVNLTLSNRCMVLLDNEKLKRLAGMTRFEIVR